MGESVVAYVVASQELDGQALDAHCLANIARYKRPKIYRFVTALLKKNYGKVRKTELRAWETSLPAEMAPGPAAG
jgi:long-chain acyl-CoA synthetase